jgi:hypothetical protein
MNDATATPSEDEVPAELSGLLHQLRQRMGTASAEEFQTFLARLAAAQADIDAALATRINPEPSAG